jgi:hypothetical protein
MGADMISLSIVSIRVLAIYLIVNSLNVAIPILSLPEAMGSIAEIKYPVWVGYVFIPMLTGTALWFLSPAISKRLSSEDQLSNFDLQESTLVRAGSFLMGIYYFVDAVPVIITTYYGRQAIAKEMIGTALISCCLIFGSKFIGSIYRKIQNGIA